MADASKRRTASHAPPSPQGVIPYSEIFDMHALEEQEREYDDEQERLEAEHANRRPKYIVSEAERCLLMTQEFMQHRLDDEGRGQRAVIIDDPNAAVLNNLYETAKAGEHDHPPASNDSLVVGKARLSYETVSEGVLHILCEKLQRPFEDGELPTPSQQLKRLELIMNSHRRAFLTESEKRTNERKCLTEFDKRVGPRIGYPAPMSKWRGPLLGEWTLQRMEERNFLSEEGAEPMPLPTLPEHISGLMGLHMVMDIYRVDDSLYAYCLFDTKPDRLYRFMGCFYGQSEQSYQADCAILENQQVDADSDSHEPDDSSSVAASAFTATMLPFPDDSSM